MTAGASHAWSSPTSASAMRPARTLSVPTSPPRLGAPWSTPATVHAAAASLDSNFTLLAPTTTSSVPVGFGSSGSTWLGPLLPFHVGGQLPNPLYYGRSSLRTHGRTHKHHTERPKTQQTYHGVTTMDNLVDSCVDTVVQAKLPFHLHFCLLYTSPSPRDQRGSRMPSSA